jgi:hypothetical protein
MKRQFNANVWKLWKCVPLLVFGGSLASAATVEYSADIFSPAGSQLPITGVTRTLALTKFDTSLGVLSGVELFVYWTDTSSITVANTDDLNAHAFSGATASIPLTLSGSGFSNLAFVASTQPIASGTSTPTFTSAPSGPVLGMPVPPAVTFVGLPCPPGQVCSFDGINHYANIQASGQNSTLVPVNNWGLFSQPGPGGTFTVSLFGGTPFFNGTEIGGSGNLMFAGDVVIGGRVVIRYTYTPGGGVLIPEPSTLLLVGPAAIWIAVRLRRKSRLDV